MGNELVKPQRSTIAQWLNTENVQQSIANVVERKDMKRFVSSVVSAVQTTPALQECTHKSILSAALLGEALNLPPSPNLNFFYMVPFKNNNEKVVEAQFQLGYKGYTQLAIRSGQYKKIIASEVREGELQSYNPITEEVVFGHVTEDVKVRLAKPVIGYYAMFELVNGFRKEIYWTREQMEEHALTYSQGYKADKRNRTSYTFWSKQFDAMAKKTMLRQLISKWGIMSVEMQKAYDADMAVIDDDGYRYVDNQPDIKANVAADVAQNANTEEFESEILDAEIVDDNAPEFMRD